MNDPNEDFSGEDHIDFNSEVCLYFNVNFLYISLCIERCSFLFKENTDYNVCILKQVQAIFAHLHYSKLQYYVPRGLWAHFK